MLSTWIQSKKDEEGFTLIELLVVVIIIGILAAIAIPVFLNQRQNGWRASVESDLRNAAMAIESNYTQFREYPTTLTGLEAGAADQPSTVTVAFYRASQDVEVAYAPGTDGFVLTGTHEQLGSETFTYDSMGGGLQTPGGGGGG